MNPSGRCAHCGTSTTPLWRRGPSGICDLCNACGIHWARFGSHRSESSPSLSPPTSFSSSSSSSSSSLSTSLSSPSSPFEASSATRRSDSVHSSSVAHETHSTSMISGDRIVWVKCKSCTHWRCLPQPIPADLLPRKWTCKRYPIRGLNRCTDKDDPDPEHTRLATLMEIKTSSQSRSQSEGDTEESPETIGFDMLPQGTANADHRSLWLNSRKLSQFKKNSPQVSKCKKKDSKKTTKLIEFAKNLSKELLTAEASKDDVINFGSILYDVLTIQKPPCEFLQAHQPTAIGKSEPLDRIHERLVLLARNCLDTDKNINLKINRINRVLSSFSKYSQNRMHPPLALHKHPLCKDVIEALHQCHRENTFTKFIGKCNDAKTKLDECLTEEYYMLLQKNWETSAEKKRRDAKKMQSNQTPSDAQN